MMGKIKELQGRMEKMQAELDLLEVEGNGWRRPCYRHAHRPRAR